MAFLGVWLRKLVGTAVVLGFLELILPEGELRRFARVVMGLLVVLVLLEPLATVFHQNLPLESVLETRVAQTPGPDGRIEQADRVIAAGMAALQEARCAELEEAVKVYCVEAAGVTLNGVRVTTEADGTPRIEAWLARGVKAQLVKRLVASHFNLPEAAVEVNADE